MSLFVPPNSDLSRIESTPGVCGGDACIKGTRLTVWMLYSSLESGTPSSKLVELFPALSPADLDAVLAYAEAHPDEVARQVAENQESD
jgi:uncharacterized protein (DUF433 family)